MTRRGGIDVAELIDRHEAARRLGVSVRTLFNMRRDGRLPADAAVHFATDSLHLWFVGPVIDRVRETLTTVPSSPTHQE